jgi:hypothetical protein
MPLITSSRYSAVASTLALALAVAGTGYAATTLPHEGSVQHQQNSTNTTPTLVVSITADGAINGELHRAPVGGVTRIKHPSAGFYILKGSGLTVQPSDSEVCSVVDYLAATATVDAVKHSLAVHVFDASGNPADIAFRCAFWKIPPLS